MAVLVERFPEWAENVELLSGGERLRALRSAAESLGADLAPPSVLELAEYAVGHPSGASFAMVAEAVAGADPSFAAAAADLEPRLVAAAALARALENDDDTAAIVAGAVLSAEFAGLATPIPELPALARAAQGRRFARVREREPMPVIEFERTVVEPPEPVDGVWRTDSKPIDRLAAATAKLAEELSRVMADVAERFETRLDAADEELDVLWWAFSSVGGELGRDWRDPYSPDALLRVGRELADRHRFNAEIPSARELLRRVLGARAEDEYDLSEVLIAAAGRVELDRVAPSPLLPILTANAAFLEVEGERSWVSVASDRGVDVTIRRRGEEIALQTLRELLLVGAVGS